MGAMTRIVVLTVVLMSPWACIGETLTAAVNAWTNGPFVAYVGDSIAEGHSQHHSVLHLGPAGNANFDIANVVWLASTNLVTGTNYGFGGRIWGLLASDVQAALANKPKYLIVHCGVNNIVLGTAWSSIESSMTSIKNTCVASNALMVLDDIYPWTAGTDEQNLTVRTWNTNMSTWAAANGVYRILSHDLMGQTRESTGYKDDLLPAYDQGDGVHISAAAYTNWAAIIITNLAAWEASTTPAQWLSAQAAPSFKPNHRMPHLTFAHSVYNTNTATELADRWGYTVHLSTYSWPSTISSLTTPGTYDYNMAALVNSDPAKYKLSVMVKKENEDVGNGFWCTNAAGQFVDYYGNTWTENTNLGIAGGWRAVGHEEDNDWRAWKPWVSPEAPESDYLNLFASWSNSLAAIQSIVPITTIIHNGESQLQGGWGYVPFHADPRVQAAHSYPFSLYTNGAWALIYEDGVGWTEYVSQQKARELGYFFDAIQGGWPNREMCLWYKSDLETTRTYPPVGSFLSNYDKHAGSWGWQSHYMNPVLDYPSFQHYYWPGSPTGDWGACWTNRPPNATPTANWDKLTKHLNAVGYDLARGYTSWVHWVSGGYSQTTTNGFSDIERFSGFLKMTYTAGNKGAAWGYYTTPTNTSGTPNPIFGGPGFSAEFPENSPPHWLQQLEALSRVHALFTYLEDIVDASDLLAGNGTHALAQDQPAYEFTNNLNHPQCRVIARKDRTANSWLIAAWASDRTNRSVVVNIPTLGATTVTCADTGNVYRATLASGPQLVNQYGEVAGRFRSSTIRATNLKGR